MRSKLSLSREAEELIEFHVEDFEEAAAGLERAGVKVERKSKHHGRITDSFGNIIGIHDHRSRLDREHRLQTPKGRTGARWLHLSY